jgi:hypothetical protein
MQMIVSPYTVPVQMDEELKSSKPQTNFTSNIIKPDLHP